VNLIFPQYFQTVNESRFQSKCEHNSSYIFWQIHNTWWKLWNFIK